MDSTVDIKVVIRKIDRIDYILSGICDYYNINFDELVKYARNPDKTKRKRIAMLILYDIADCSLKDIANALYQGKGTEHTVWWHLSGIRDDLSSDSFGNIELKIEYNRIIKHLNL